MGRRDRSQHVLLAEPVIDTVAGDAPRMSVTIPGSQLGEDGLAGRVAAIEATVSALVFSTFGARGAEGQMLARCRCGLFATRRVTIDHRVAGMHSECLCDSCKPGSPLAIEGVPQSEAPLLGIVDRTTVTRVNRGLEQARLWGAS
jgi:hypothetical protein